MCCVWSTGFLQQKHFYWEIYEMAKWMWNVCIARISRCRQFLCPFLQVTHCEDVRYVWPYIACLAFLSWKCGIKFGLEVMATFSVFAHKICSRTHILHSLGLFRAESEIYSQWIYFDRLQMKFIIFDERSGEQIGVSEERQRLKQWSSLKMQLK